MPSDQAIVMRIAEKRYPLSHSIAEWLRFRRTTICEKVAAIYSSEVSGG